MYNCFSLDEYNERFTGSYFVSTYPPFSVWTQDQIPEVHQVLNTLPDSSNTTSLGIYVHIPFCAQRCSYCYYQSYDDKSAGEVENYFDALVCELEMYKRMPLLAARKPSFIYFGGGTPSLPNAHLIEKLLCKLQNIISWSRAKEVTFECAPKTVSEKKMRILKQAGVTRISLGIQSFDDDVLLLNNRIHLSDDIERAYEVIRCAGFDVVNIDLMVGLPGETRESFMNSVDQTIKLGADCITIYQLEIPQNTPLYRNLEQNNVKKQPASWSIKRERLAEGFDRLEVAGYSIRSAYAVVRDPAQHPFVYQDEQYHGADLLGIGVASFSYLQGVHFQNQTSFSSYMNCIQHDQLPLSRAYVLNDDERMIRELVLQLKLGYTDFTYLSEKFGHYTDKRIIDTLQEFSDHGWLRMDKKGVTMTREGLLCVDHLIPSLYLPQHQNIRYS